MLKLILTQGYTYNASDYGRTYTFKIYDEADTAFNATSYNAPIIHILDQYGNLENEIIGAWTTQASGIGTFSFSSTNLITATSGRDKQEYTVQVQLEKSGEVTTTQARRIHVFDSAD